MLIHVIKNFNLKEYDDVVLQKWMDGKRCSVGFTQIYDHCRDVIKSRGDDWTEE